MEKFSKDISKFFKNPFIPSVSLIFFKNITINHKIIMFYNNRKGKQFFMKKIIFIRKPFLC